MAEGGRPWVAIRRHCAAIQRSRPRHDTGVATRCAAIRVGGMATRRAARPATLLARPATLLARPATRSTTRLRYGALHATTRPRHGGPKRSARSLCTQAEPGCAPGAPDSVLDSVHCF